MKRRPRQSATSIGQSIPAPIGGWDTESPIAAMPIENALILDNWIPRSGYVEIRRGYVPQVTGTPAAVESMIAFRGSAGGDLLFACSNGNIYNVTTSGAPLGAPVWSGNASNRWQYLNFANPAGAWVLAFNGVDPPLGYNGGAWGALAITGSSGPIILNPNSLVSACAHQARVLAIESGTLHCWFAAAAAVEGAFELLDLGSVFNKGGQLVAIGSWTWQYGVTSDDFVAFLTNQGQVAVYQGIDPSNANDWALVGLFDMGKPVGPRALIKYGGDLLVLTTDGPIALSQVLKLDESRQAGQSLTRKINSAFASAVRAYRNNYGWQGILYAGDTTTSNLEADGGGLAIFNIPITTLGTSMQYVMNTLTGAWCRFLDLPAFCWEIANDCIYFGSTFGVYQWDAGSSDNGTPITYDLKSAFSNFNSATNKRFTMIRPLLNTIGLVTPTLDVDVDYQESEPTATPVIVSPGVLTPTIRYDWTGASGEGYVGAVRMQIVLEGSPSQPLVLADSAGDTVGIDGTGDSLAISSGLPFDVPCQLIGFDIMYQKGGPI